MGATQSAGGGDSKIWLDLSLNNFNEIRRKWTQSINDQNLHPLEFRQLVPIWELVGELNSNKGHAVKAYLEGQWAHQLATLRDEDRLDLATVDWSDAGCWRNEPRVWSHGSGNSFGRIGYQECRKKAEQRGATYFSVEDGSHCWVHDEAERIEAPPVFPTCARGGEGYITH